MRNGRDGRTARLEALRAKVAAREGRVDEAIAAVESARAALGHGAPALDRIEGDAYAAVWEWPRAREAYARVARASPQDAGAFADLARALGSSGEEAASLAAARGGLALSPRDPALLRSQALALRRLGAPDAAAAEDAYLANRVPDERPARLARCVASVPGCSRDRDPVPRYRLSPPRHRPATVGRPARSEQTHPSRSDDPSRPRPRPPTNRR